MRLLIVSFCIVVCLAVDVGTSLGTPTTNTQTDPDKEFLDSLDHPGNPYRSLRYAGTPTEIKQCNEGLCCNKELNLFRSYGLVCGELKNECKVAICSGQSSECYPINIADGRNCKNGQCFEGECITNCVGECCDGPPKHRYPKKDGEECENGMCVNGVCVKKCYDDCCESFQAFAKPDGALCFNGTCQNGKCVLDGGANDAVAVLYPEEMKDPLNGQKAIAVVVDEKKPNALDSEWGKLVQEETKRKEELRKEELEKRKEEQEKQLQAINDERDQKLADLKANNSAKSGDLGYWLYGIIGAGVLVGVLLIVLIVVAVVVRNRKKKQRAKIEKDSADTYEAF